MPKPRPPYPVEFRQQMLEWVEAGKTPAELAREFDVSAQTIANWVGPSAVAGKQPSPSRDALSSAERAELMRLRRENRQLKTERDILAKATAWFARKGDPSSTPSSSS